MCSGCTARVSVVRSIYNLQRIQRNATEDLNAQERSVCCACNVVGHASRMRPLVTSACRPQQKRDNMAGNSPDISDMGEGDKKPTLLDRAGAVAAQAAGQVRSSEIQHTQTAWDVTTKQTMPRWRFDCRQDALWPGGRRAAVRLGVVATPATRCMHS